MIIWNLKFLCGFLLSPFLLHFLRDACCDSVFAQLLSKFRGESSKELKRAALLTVRLVKPDVDQYCEIGNGRIVVINPKNCYIQGQIGYEELWQHCTGLAHWRSDDTSVVISQPSRSSSPKLRCCICCT